MLRNLNRIVAVMAVGAFAGLGFATAPAAAVGELGAECSGDEEHICYDVPDGCGVGVGCIHTNCADWDCPERTGFGMDGCHYCDSEPN